MPYYFNPLIKEQFDYYEDSPVAEEAGYLKLDQTTPQTITGGVPVGLEGSYTHKITFNMIGTADEQAWVQIPYDCTIAGYELTADQSGDIVIDLWVGDYSAFPPTVADTITAAAKPTLSSAQASTDSALTGWTKTLSAGDYLLANVDSAGSFGKQATDTRVDVNNQGLLP